MDKKSILIALFALFCTAMNAQTGVFHFSDTESDRPYVHIIDMKEGSDKSIYLLGESKNSSFDSTALWYARIDSKGKLINQVSRGTDVEDLKRIFLVSDEKVLCIGNKPSYTGKPQSFANYYTKEGRPQDLSVMAMSYPIILGDAVQTADNSIYAVQANQNKETKLFNLAIVKAPVDKFMPMQINTIQSDFHEIPSSISLNDKNELIVACLRIGEQEKPIPLIYKLDAQGKEIWKYKPEVDAEFMNITTSFDSKDNVILAFGYRDNSNYTSFTILKKLNSKREEIQTEIISDIKSNGIVKLKNGKMLLYGGNFKAYDNRMIISRACFTILNEDLTVFKADEINEKDNPEKSFSTEVMIENPLSSEFMTAIQLNDGRISIGGRILIPEKTDAENIKEAQRINKALVLFTDSEGNFR
jgi:hypothetical protein